MIDDLANTRSKEEIRPSSDKQKFTRISRAAIRDSCGTALRPFYLFSRTKVSWGIVVIQLTHFLRLVDWLTG